MASFQDDEYECADAMTLRQNTGQRSAHCHAGLPRVAAICLISGHGRRKAGAHDLRLQLPLDVPEDWPFYRGLRRRSRGESAMLC